MWQIAPGQCLSHRRWDSEVVLFNDLSGDTHLLGEDALALLLLLRAAPHSAAALAQRLAPDEEDGAAIVSGMLADLAAIALVAPLAPLAP